MKIQEKISAIKLRKMGKSYGEILNEINVSKSTLSIWLRDINLSVKQKNRIYKEIKQKNAYRLAKINQQKRVERTKKIIKKAKNESKKMFDNPLFITGLMLYWAEGDKSERNEIVKFTNSDPEMIRIMLLWFEKVCKVDKECFRITLHIHNLFCKNYIEKYWSQILKIPKKQFYKTQIKKSSLNQRRNELYYGTCSIRINSRDLFRKLKGWKMGFIEKLMSS